MKKKHNLLTKHTIPEKNLSEALKNYKELRMPEAKSKGLESDLQRAQTLTQARKIMQGVKIK